MKHISMCRFRYLVNGTPFEQKNFANNRQDLTETACGQLSQYTEENFLRFINHVLVDKEDNKVTCPDCIKLLKENGL